MEFIDPALLIKLASTAILVVLATSYAERFGAFVGAIVASMPIAVGPAYLFIAMEHDAGFVATSARTSLGVHAMMPLMLITCAGLVERYGVAVAMGAAMTVWVVGGVAVTWVQLTIGQAVLLNVATFSIALVLSRGLAGDMAVAVPRRGRFDVLFRVAAVVAVVGAAILIGRLIGPKAAGLAALVPVVWISVAFVLTARSGRRRCSAVLANGIPAMIGFAFAFLAIAELTVGHGSAFSLSLALAIIVIWNLGFAAMRPYLLTYGAR